MCEVVTGSTVSHTDCRGDCGLGSGVPGAVPAVQHAAEGFAVVVEEVLGLLGDAALLGQGGGKVLLLHLHCGNRAQSQPGTRRGPGRPPPAAASLGKTSAPIER